jgi:hypothetical protein
LKNSKKLMAVFGAVAFMLVAGWQFGVSEAEAPFSEKEVALEKAIAGSGTGGTCYNTITTQEGSQILYCGTCSWVMDSTNSWVSSTSTCSS